MVRLWQMGTLDGRRVVATLLPAYLRPVQSHPHLAWSDLLRPAGPAQSNADQAPAYALLAVLIALAAAALWEVVENSPVVVERYRAATMSQNYLGDSVANSLGDILACGLGFLLAKRLGWAGSLALFLAGGDPVVVDSRQPHSQYRDAALARGGDQDLANGGPPGRVGRQARQSGHVHFIRWTVVPPHFMSRCRTVYSLDTGRSCGACGRSSGPGTRPSRRCRG